MGRSEFFKVTSPEIRQQKSRVSPARPFTVAHFRRWCQQLILDTGEPWELERFQAEFVKDLFIGRTENWLVIPEGNAKTTLAAGVVLYHAQFRHDARVVVAASSRDQAEWLFDAAQGFVYRSELGVSVRKAHESRKEEPDRFACFPGLREIRVNLSKIKIFAADDRTGDGANFTLAILEELHRHRDLRLYRTWRGKAAKRGGQLMAISTAGEPEGEFEEVRSRIKVEAEKTMVRGGFIRAVSPTVCIHDYAVPEGRNTENMRDVKLANPLKAITLQVLTEKRNSPAMVPSHWRRFACGVPANVDAWLAPEEWDPLKVDFGFTEGERVWIAVRYGQQGGAGIGIVAQRDAGFLVEIQQLPYEFERLQFALRLLRSKFDIQAIYVDPRHFGGESLAEEVLKGLPVESDFQTPVRLMEATATFLRHISNRTLYHSGDWELRKQVMAGRAKENTTGAYLEPSADTQALVALVMAVHEATVHANDKPPRIFAYRGA